MSSHEPKPPVSQRPRGAAWLCAVYLAVGLYAVPTVSTAAPLPSPHPQRDSREPVALVTVQQIPTPEMSAQERDFRDRVTSMLGDVASIKVSQDDVKALKAIKQHLAKGRLESAESAAAKIISPEAQRIAQAYKVASGYVTAGDAASFFAETPYWPRRDRLRRTVETSVFTSGGRADEIIALFSAEPPMTGPGMAAFASALEAVGRRQEAHEHAGRAWRENLIPDSLETGFLERFNTLLTQDDHRARLDRLLAESFRSKRRRNARANDVRRMLPLLELDEQKMATARLSLYLGQSGAMKLVGALKKAQRESPRLLRQRVQYDVRTGKFEKAADRLSRLPGGANSGAPDADWELRRAVARQLIKAEDFKRAYGAVKSAWPDDENERKEAAFLGGWLALRKLSDTKSAIAQFERMKSAADGPLSRSKSHYWLARALAADGQSETAAQEFERGGAYLDTFHGALSRAAQDPPQRSLSLPLPAAPTAADVSRFKAREIVKIGLWAHKARLSQAFIRNLFTHLAWRVDNPAEIVLTAQLAERMGRSQIAVRAGKAGVARGHPHYIYSYPIHHLPAFEPLRTPPESELLLSIARQESEFNSSIVSRAGARGVLQVMPITARHVCRVYSMRCEIGRLLRDRSYNARIAAAYIADQTDAVAGNMILTLTGYNAGPGRTRQWLRQRGDPRTDKLDPLDWVYAIPFEETRLYVQKVLSNLQVYRARLGVKEPLRVDRELGYANPKALR